ncbi:unnamed protein product [Alopecurus aequalis]
MPHHLLQESVERLTEIAAPPMAATKAGGMHMETLLILGAVLCFLLCVVGLALVARCSWLCNPSVFSVDAMPPKAPCTKGMKKKALQSLPTVLWAVRLERMGAQEVPECAICLAQYACGDEVRVLPPCGHGFHAACVDVWLLSCSTCPSCRGALVVSPPQSLAKPPATCSSCAAANVAAAQASATGRCRSSAS